MKKERTVARVVGIPSNNLIHPPHEDVVFLSRVGIEIEAENVTYSKCAKEISNMDLWRMVNDGSLRQAGREFVSVPVAGQNIIIALKQVQEVLDASGAQVSERTGLHVHMDALDMTYKQLLNFIVVYTIFEKEIYRYVGDVRANNPYCLPITEAINLQQLLNQLKGSDVQLRSVLVQWPKYSGFNLASLRKYGTVEFRMHPGEVNTGKILDFINIILCMKRYVVINELSPQSIIDSVCLEGDRLVTEVFAGSVLDMTAGYIDRMLEGARIAQQFYRTKPILDKAANEHHARLLDEIQEGVRQEDEEIEITAADWTAQLYPPGVEETQLENEQPEPRIAPRTRRIPR